MSELVVSAAAPGGDISPLTDDQLIAQFNELRDELISTLAYILNSRDEALDAAQDTFLKCWRSRETSGDVQNLRAWIFRVGLNTARDFQRSAWRRKARPLGDEFMLAARENTSNTLEDRETLERLQSAIRQLRPDEMEVFLLRQNGEMTYEQIAAARNSPVGTVKTQMRSALAKLRKLLN